MLARPLGQEGTDDDEQNAVNELVVELLVEGVARAADDHPGDHAAIAFLTQPPEDAQCRVAKALQLRCQGRASLGKRYHAGI
jgi:hypothetical protein